jgi:hypothetical protein
MKTSELMGAALDRAVGKAMKLPEPYWHEGRCPCFSTDWAQGGPIIEREGIKMGRIDSLNGPYWEAHMPYGTSDDSAEGSTPLVAAMRCYVASKLGDEVEVPEQYL